MRSRRMNSNTAVPVRGGSNTANHYPSGGNGGGGDSYIDTHYERAPSAASKVSNSLKGMLMGPILIVLGCILLWYNEGWAIKTHRSLNEALDAFHSIPSATAYPSGEFENKLVHLSHKISVDNPSIDHDFQLSRDAISLSRHVEIYQWVETKKTERRKRSNGQTEVNDIFSYEPKWVKSPVNSQSFRHSHNHENVGSLPFVSNTFKADGVNIGSYRLGNDVFINQIRGSSVVDVKDMKRMPGHAHIKGNELYFAIDNNYSYNNNDINSNPHGLTDEIDKSIVTIDGQDKIMYTVKTTGQMFSNQQQALDALTHLPQQRYDKAVSIDSTQIGDVRIKFTEVPCTVVSVLGQLIGNVLTPWKSKQGSGYDIAILSMGNTSAEDMVKGKQSSNTIVTWFVRAGGWMLNLLGFSMITQIISTTADISLHWIPLFGSMAVSVVHLGVSVANVVLASSTAVLVAALAWIFYRPVLGASMLVGSLGVFFLASQAGKNKVRKAGTGKLY